MHASRLIRLAGLIVLFTLAAPFAAQATTVNFTTPCTTATFTVPAGVTSITVQAFGAQGGAAFSSPGGLGGQATATLTVVPATTLFVNVGGVGGSGATGGAGGCNAGGAGGGTGGSQAGAGGGGSSDVRQDGTGLANRVVVAGGGGGASVINAGGGGGGTSGLPGGGGTGEGGGRGTQTGPGAGGTFGDDGGIGVGGAGAGASFPDGGGGGFFGGGGGGSSEAVDAGGGGYVPAGGTLVAGVQAGNGLVQITYGVVAVTLRSFEASSSRQGNVLRWRTASEVDTLGFVIYRQLNGPRVRVNRKLIAARGAGSYSFVDRGARSVSPKYWLQVVNLDGSRNWYGPARVSRAT